MSTAAVVLLAIAAGVAVRARGPAREPGPLRTDPELAQRSAPEVADGYAPVRGRPRLRPVDRLAPAFRASERR